MKLHSKDKNNIFTSDKKEIAVERMKTSLRMTLNPGSAAGALHQGAPVFFSTSPQNTGGASTKSFLAPLGAKDWQESGGLAGVEISQILGVQGGLFGADFLIKKNYLTKAIKSEPFHGREVVPKNVPVPLDWAVKEERKAPGRCSAGGYLPFICKNGHLQRKQIGCHKEYCSVCGEKWGLLHQQRFFRGKERVEYIFSVQQSLGYLVLGIPDEFRKKIIAKELSRLQNFILKFLQREDFNYGVSVWHWCGEDGKTFKPHLNILFASKFLSPEKLAKIRKVWSREVKKLMSEEIRKQFVSRMKREKKKFSCVVNFYYYIDRKKIYHKWRYVCRPTWRTYSDKIHNVVFNFRNIRWFGNFKHKIKENEFEKVEKCKCAVCSEPLYVPKYFGFNMNINTEDYFHCGGGIFVWKFVVPEIYRDPKPPD